jgi:uncharacterized protein (DUF2147 family)
MNGHGAILRASLVAVPLAAAMAAEPSAVGEWVTEGGKARVRVEPCGGDPLKLCGAIIWSYRPEDAAPGPLVDVNNQEPALRSRPILGLPLLQDFEPDGPGAWSGGTIYDPEGGKTYRSKMRLDGPDRLEVEGCVLFVCRGQTWSRYRG